MPAVTLTWPLAFDPSSVSITNGSGIGPVGNVADAPKLRARTNLPRRGLDIPVGVNSRGSSRTVTSDENDRKIISTALSDNHNDNAFQQDPGLGADMIYAVNSDAIRGIIIQRLRDVFAEFERQNRYKLKEDTAVWSGEESELVLDFDYFNIETDEQKHFSGALQRVDN